MMQELPLEELGPTVRDLLVNKHHRNIHISFEPHDAAIVITSRKKGALAGLRGNHFRFPYDECPYCAMTTVIESYKDAPPFRGIDQAYLARVNSDKKFYLIINAGRRGWGGLWYHFPDKPYTTVAGVARHTCPAHTP